MSSTTIFRARKIITMNPRQPAATHVAVRDGFVLGAGSVLTKNPGPYEIWAGAPAKKIGYRDDIDEKILEGLVSQKRYSL